MMLFHFARNEKVLFIYCLNRSVVLANADAVGTMVQRGCLVRSTDILFDSFVVYTCILDFYCLYCYTFEFSYEGQY